MDIDTHEILICSISFVDAASNFINTAYQFIYSSLISLIDFISQFVSPNFFMVIFGTFVAAAAGSFGAQHFINKQQKKDTLLSEIRSTNSAIMAAFNICNSCLSLKKQHVKLLKEVFESHKNECEIFKERIKAKTIKPGETFNFSADFQSIPPLSVPIDILEKQMFEKISAKGRELGLTISLARAIQSLNRAINHRNELADQTKYDPHMVDEKLVNFYFGFPDGVGRTDTNYSDAVSAIHDQTDDCIFISKLLCEDLYVHGTKLEKALGKKTNMINEPDFEIAGVEELMPNEENYDYLKKMYRQRKKS